MWTGRLEEAKLRLERTISAFSQRVEIGAEVWGGSNYLWALTTRALVEAFAGDLEKANEMFDRSIELARTHGERQNEGWALGWFGFLAQIDGDFGRGLTVCQRGAEIAERVGGQMMRGMAHRPLGLMLTLNGRHEEAVALLETALDNARRRQTDLYSEAGHLAFLAEAYLAAGKPVAAMETAEEGIRVGKDKGSMVMEAHSHLTLARILRRQGGDGSSQGIRKALVDSEELYDKTGARNFKAFVHLERAELARLEGDAGARKQELEAALRLFREMKAPIRVREVEGLLADTK